MLIEEFYQKIIENYNYGEKDVYKRQLYDYTFSKDNGINPEMKLAHNYVSNWEEMKANASGLLIWGDVGKMCIRDRSPSHRHRKYGVSETPVSLNSQNR